MNVLTVFLQETLLLEDRQGDLMFIDENYDSAGLGAYYSEKALLTNAGRAEGGLACLWRKNSCFEISKVIVEDKYMALEVAVGNDKILLVNVYIKSDLWEARTLDAYLNYLNDLEYLITSTKLDCIYFWGDFNADPYSGRAWHNLLDFMHPLYLLLYQMGPLIVSGLTTLLVVTQIG